MNRYLCRWISYSRSYYHEDFQWKDESGNSEFLDQYGTRGSDGVECVFRSTLKFYYCLEFSSECCEL